QRARVNLRPVVDDMGGELTEAGHEVDVSGEQHAQIDGRRAALKRALRNLVENAVKYGRRANLRLTATRNELVVTIDDDGPGIPESELENVFRPFHRVEPSRSRETGGARAGPSLAPAPGPRPR